MNARDQLRSPRRATSRDWAASSSWTTRRSPTRPRRRRRCRRASDWRRRARSCWPRWGVTGAMSRTAQRLGRRRLLRRRGVDRGRRAAGPRQRGRRRAAPRRGDGPARRPIASIPVVAADAAVRDVPDLPRRPRHGHRVQDRQRARAGRRAARQGHLPRGAGGEEGRGARADRSAPVRDRSCTRPRRRSRATRRSCAGAKRNLDRYESVGAASLIPQQQVDDQRALVDQLTGDGAASTRRQIENAQLQLDYARITSPIDGVTGVRLVDPGQPGARRPTRPASSSITQLDPIAVLFTLPQDDLPDVSREHGEGPADGRGAAAATARQLLAHGQARADRQPDQPGDRDDAPQGDLPEPGTRCCGRTSS